MTLFRAHEPARANAKATFVLAHGAGAGQDHPWMKRYAEGLVARGVRVVTFDFPYMQAKRRAPDRPHVLEEHYRRVVAAVHARFRGPLFIGGKSMGGRIASQIAAADEALPISGLVFFGYPLHPPSQPEKRRDAHLPKIRVPMLLVCGTRDPFGSERELRALAKKLGSELFVVEGGDHSLEARENQDENVWDRAAAFVLSESRTARPRRRRTRERPNR